MSIRRGDIVLYRDPQTKADLVAFVVFVHSPEMVNLYVLPDGVWQMGGGMLVNSVRRDDDLAPSCWAPRPA